MAKQAAKKQRATKKQQTKKTAKRKQKLAKKTRSDKKTNKRAKQKKTVLFVPEPEQRPEPEAERGPPVPAWTCAGRQPGRAGTQRERLAPPLRLLWRAELEGPAAAAPVVARDGVLYAIDDSGGLTVLDAESGARIAQLHTDPVGEGSPLWPLVQQGLVPPAAVPVSSAPAVSGWHLCFGDDEGIFYGLRRGDLKVTWRKVAPELSLAARNRGAYQAPLVVDGVVYTADADGNLYAADARSGKTRFARYLRGRPAGPPALGRGRLLVATHPAFPGEAPALHALGAWDGERVWRQELPAPPHPGLAIRDQRVYVSCHDALRSFDLRDGNLAWSCASSAAPAGTELCLDRERAYLSGGSEIRSLALGDGAQIWTRSTQLQQPLQGLASAGGVLWGAGGRSLLAWDGTSGKALARIRVPGTVVGGPALALGRVYLATRAGAIVAFRAV